MLFGKKKVEQQKPDEQVQNVAQANGLAIQGEPVPEGDEALPEGYDCALFFHVQTKFDAQFVARVINDAMELRGVKFFKGYKHDSTL